MPAPRTRVAPRKPAHPEPAPGSLLPAHFLVLALLLALPATALCRLGTTPVQVTAALVTLLASAFTYGFYAWDKRRARAGEWRISERMLHLWELIGGWPGAFLAQRRFRHKSAKPSYLFVFWLIVAAHNFAALDWQLDWKLSRATAAQIHDWLGSATSDSPPPRSKVY